MSLINIKNFVEPIIDKRNLVTIVLVAGLFGMIRLSGGKAGTVVRTREPGRGQPVQASTGKSALGTPDRRDSSRGAERGRTILDELNENDPLRNEVVVPVKPSTTSSKARDPLIESARKTPVAPKREAKPQSRGSEGLDDIEKQLGLR